MTETVTRGRYAIPVEGEAVRAHWQSEGFSFGRFVDPPGQEWNDFVHATDEYVTVEDGRLEITVGPETFIAEPGDLVFIPRGVSHSLKNISGKVTRWLYGYG
ncbi:cupin domain-containing protein [Hwanghaeella grinnelliae]|uniref:Cupin domain-containing protein n=1 Tax=Hwanghaeella grinnelliae TaxID=2500179 RepID=A0A3S2Z508_9PROT|nr:cupin domain-containing protein [Hwanghaeella grinnelliae]RVU33985.1 cupin domain-containing protein [Hwanghaeella grinnelliae]